MPEQDGERSSGRLLISQLIRLAHRDQNKNADPLSDESGSQVTRCPMPGHWDERPSCLFDNDKGDTGHFYCRSCGESGFGDQLAQRLFPGKSERDLLAEVHALEDSAPTAEPPRNIPRAPSGQRRRAVPTPPNHRQALAVGSDDAAVERRRRDLLSVNEAAARWYEAHLASQPSSRAAAESEFLGKTYFRRRGIDDRTLADFRLGYAPPDTSDDLALHLNLQGFSRSLPVQADIFRSSKANPNYHYSPFAGRAMLPMQDEEGNVIGFGGRLVERPNAANAAKKAYSPKYMHSANIWVVDNTVPLFKKGDWFFNMHRARPLVSDAGRLLVVEGYLDVVGLHQAGIREVISPIGVSLSETQLRRVWDLADTPIICLDGDDAGRRAAGRVAAKAYALLYPDAAKTLEKKVAEVLAGKPAKILSDEERAALADEAAAMVPAGRKSLSFAMLDGGKDPFDVVREGMDRGLRLAVMNLSPCSGEELSDKMHQGGASAFEAKLLNPITLETMVVEKLARDIYDKSKRASQMSDAADLKRKRDDELEMPSAKRPKTNGPEAAELLETYLARKNFIRHQIMFPLVSWEARSPHPPHAEAGDPAWRTSILDLRRNIKTALAGWHQEERRLLLPLADKMSERQIEHIVSATAALQDHDRARSPEWITDLPIGSAPPPRLPFSSAPRGPDRGRHADDAIEAVKSRSRNYARVNGDLLRFELASHASFEPALSDAATRESMIAARDRRRADIRGVFDARLALHRKELDRPVEETPPVGNAVAIVDRGLDRVREVGRGP